MRVLDQHRMLGVVLVALAVLMVACGGGASPTPPGRGGSTPTPTERPPTPVPTKPSATPSPSATPASTATPTASPTVGVSDCKLGSAFVADVTIPDGSKIEAGSEFTKTWEIQNTGTCTWTVGYRFAHMFGEKMGAPDFVSVPETAPGESAELSVPMKAPAQPGEYRSNWRLCPDSGQCFGATVWLEIVSQAPSGAPTVTGTPAPTETPTPAQ